MSTYTQAEVDEVKGAILALAKGDRTVSVRFADREETFQPADLDKLQALLVRMQADVAAAAGAARPRQYVAVDSRRF